MVKEVSVATQVEVEVSRTSDFGDMSELLQLKVENERSDKYSSIE